MALFHWRQTLKRSQFFRVAVVAALFAATATVSFAQPAQTIKLVVGFPAGGVVDAIARAFAEQARQVIGATLVVDNRAGASGKIAIDAMLNAPADGLTVMIAPASLIELAPMVMPTAKYDAVKDISAIGALAEYGFAVAAGPFSGAKDINEYKAWAKANPAKSSFATPGQGTPQEFLGSQLQKALDIDLVHVPYKGGAPAINDVMGGQVPILVTTEQLLVPYEGQGKLNTLFITSRKRNSLMPNVPTAKEAGLPQLESTDWFGAFVKAGTPVEKVNTWKAHVQKVLASPGYIEAIKKLGYAVPEKQPTDFPALLQAERAAWAERVKLSGFKPVQ